MKVKSADGVSIAYQVQGKGKPALVFVHGWCCDRTYWDAQVSHFAQQYRVVTVDLAGHGESGLNRKTWTMASFGEDVRAAIEKLGLNQIVLVGHSMGGPVILEATRRMPKRVMGVVGVDTFHDLERKYTQDQIDQILAPFRTDFAEAMRNLVRDDLFTINSDSTLVERIAADMSVAPPTVGLGAGEALLHYYNRYPEVLQEVRTPIRCINSDMDPTNVEAGQRYAQSFEVTLMSGVGHFVMLEDPATFNRLLDGVLKELVCHQAAT